MKRILLMMLFVVCATSSSIWADMACPTTGPGDNLGAYEVSGFACTYGDLTFSDFSYSASGSDQVPAADVTVTPVTVGGEMGLQFNAPWGTPPGDTTDSFINFTATCNSDCSIDDLALNIGGASADTGGIVLVSETSPVLTGSLQAGAAGSTTILTDSATFSPVTSVTVSKDILVNGGTSGLGSQVSNVQNLFSTTTPSTVPEPSTVFLCLGMLGLVPMARRKFGF